MSRVLALTLALLVGLGGLSPVAGWAQSKAASAAAKIDLNTATQAELEKLPGVGEVTAKKIIAGRPYSSVGDLSRAGVPAKTIEKITPLVSATGSAPAAKSTTTETPAGSGGKTASATTGKTSSVAKSTGTSKSSTTEARVPPEKGMVWVNTNSGVFHYEGDRWYGKTKEGKFLTEADALKAGYRASKQGGPKEGSAKK